MIRTILGGCYNREAAQGSHCVLTERVCRRETATERLFCCGSVSSGCSQYDGRYSRSSSQRACVKACNSHTPVTAALKPCYSNHQPSPAPPLPPLSLPYPTFPPPCVIPLRNGVVPLPVLKRGLWFTGCCERRDGGGEKGGRGHREGARG